MLLTFLEGPQTSQVRGARPAEGSPHWPDEITASNRSPVQVSYLTLERDTPCCSPPSGIHLRNVRLAESSSGGCFQIVFLVVVTAGRLFFLLFFAVIQRVCCRYEDNGDAVNNLLVICKSTGNKSIEDFGSPDKWLQENAKLLGEDVWKGKLCLQSGFANTVRPMLLLLKTMLRVAAIPSRIFPVGLSRSEGGFKENKVSSASVLDVQAANDKKGKPYYKYEILTRTGTHPVIIIIDTCSSVS